MFLRALRKLAGLLPVNEVDRDEVAYFQKSGRGSEVSLGTSPAMKELRERVRRMAPLDEPVLILGPSGSGKELVARALHAGSPRREERFYPVNCAVLGTGPDLAYDRLFGHVAGAYTNARSAEPGAFDAACGGTLFLDEVAELPPQVQTQLLRVLEEATISPLGSVDAHPVDVRVVAATNRDLPSLVRDGLFRLDLYYRLNVLPVEVPPLMERIQDVKSIAGSILSELKAKGHQYKLTDRDFKAIRSYDWPGNVRQLSNLLKRAAYLKLPFTEVLDRERRLYSCAGEVDRSGEAEALRLFLPGRPEDVSPEAEIRRAYMRHVFELFGGNYSRACRALGISDNTLRKWVAE